MSIELCNGAFTADLVKGKWKYTYVPKKLEKKKSLGSLKEKPQYAVIEKYEAASVERFQRNVRTTVLEIARFLKEETL